MAFFGGASPCLQTNQRVGGVVSVFEGNDGHGVSCEKRQPKTVEWVSGCFGLCVAFGIANLVKRNLYRCFNYVLNTVNTNTNTARQLFMECIQQIVI